MFISIVASYMLYSLVTAYTPGPNNVVALYAVSQCGWKKGKQVLFGMAVGFLLVMVLSALFCYCLKKYAASFTDFLKYIGAIYIVWLAFHIVLNRSKESDNKTMGFLSGFTLQFLNVKIILYAITTYTGYVLPFTSNFSLLIVHAFCFTLIGMSGVLAWAFAGKVFQKLLKKYCLPFNVIMALILIYCAITMIVENF